MANRSTPRRSLETRFWSKVDRRGPDECWPWTGSKLAKGYGLLGVGGRNARATHVALLLIDGVDVPSGMVVCHSCDNPSCVNPAHLWLGTVAENHHDAMRKGRNAKGSKHGESKLSDADVLRIRHGAAHGRTRQDLAREFGVTHQNIGLIVRRRAWVHLD